MRGNGHENIPLVVEVRQVVGGKVHAFDSRVNA